MPRDPSSEAHIVRCTYDVVCHHCFRPVPPATLLRMVPSAHDPSFTLHMHVDCDALWRRFVYERNLTDAPRDALDGPSITDYWTDLDLFDDLCHRYRGHYPHAVTRLELGDQLAQIRIDARREGRMR